MRSSPFLKYFLEIMPPENVLDSPLLIMESSNPFPLVQIGTFLTPFVWDGEQWPGVRELNERGVLLHVVGIIQAISDTEQLAYRIHTTRVFTRAFANEWASLHAHFFGTER